MIPFSLPIARRSGLALAALVVTALSGCNEPAAPLAREGRPDVLEFHLGSFARPTSGVTLRGDTVVAWSASDDWSSSRRVDTVRVVPSAEAWRTFWSAADRAGVSEWRRQYVAENVLDGVGWSLRIQAGARGIESTGSNAYPDRSGAEWEMEMTSDFRTFVSAVETLAGRQL